MPPQQQATTQHPLYTQLLTSLTQAHLTPDRTWLSTFLSQHTSSTSLSTLLAATKTHLLASNITTTLSRISILPGDITSANTPSRTLSADTPVQIINIIDIGRSTWTQLQDLEMDARGERAVGRNAIVRIAEDESNDGDDDMPPPSGSGPGGAGNVPRGPWTVLLQDAAGALVWGFDGEGVLLGGAAGSGGLGGNGSGIGAGNVDEGKMPSIGCKLVLRRGCAVARGVVLLERASVLVLGGVILEMDAAWREGRIERFKALLQGGQ